MSRLRELHLFLAGAAIVGLHLADVAAWRPLVLVAGAAAAYRVLPPGARAALAGALAPLAFFGAWLHVLHVSWDGFARTDATGLALAAAGALFAASCVAALRTRRPLPRARRVLRALASAGAALLLALFFVVPVTSAMWLAGKPRQPLSPLTLPVRHVDVTLRAADGTKLRGWWVPAHNGAAVVLVHGGGGDRDGLRRHAAPARARGVRRAPLRRARSRRKRRLDPETGWNSVQDVRAAVDFASSRPGVRTVGALGLSTGAEVAVTAAAHDRRLAAVVAEGLISRDLVDSEHQSTGDNIAGAPYWWVTYHALELETGTHPPSRSPRI